MIYRLRGRKTLVNSSPLLSTPPSSATGHLRRNKGGNPTDSAFVALAAFTLFVLLFFAYPFYYRNHDYNSLPHRPSQSAKSIPQLNYTLEGPARLLTTDFYIPPAVSNALTKSQAGRLLEKLQFASGSFGEPARLLVIHVQNGLGNRLRALSSGLAMARATRRVPLIVWEADAHLGAKFGDILQATHPNIMTARDTSTILYGDLIVTDTFPAWDLVSGRTIHWRPYNYMIKDGKLAKQGEVLYWLPTTVKCTPKKTSWFVASKSCRKNADTIAKRSHVYFKSAYVAANYPGHLSYSARVNTEMRALRPAPEVLDIVREQFPLRVKYIFGAHVRSRLIARDGVKVDDRCEYSGSAEEMTNYWRSQSSLQEFMNLLHYLFKRYPQLHFFMAADDSEALKTAAKRFPGKVHYIKRDCDDREPHCVRYAMADLLCLARCARIYGSNWSSFTEAAGRLANKRPVLSGLHFGKLRGTNHKKFSLRRWIRKMTFSIMRTGANCG